MVFCTQDGTIPGSPLADLLFQVVMTVALDSILENLESAGLNVCMPLPHELTSPTRVGCPVPTWLDDAAILLESESALKLVGDVASAAAIASEGLQLIGIKMNFQEGKSEAILQFAGPGSKEAKHEALVENRGLIPVNLGDGVVQLRCVQSYVHLGTTASAEPTHIKDVKRRRQITEAVFGPLHRRLLFNPWLWPVEKTRLLQTLILNKFCHGAGLWRLHTKTAMATFKAAYMSFVRRSVRPIAKHSSKLLTDAEACAIVHVLLPEEALDVARYRQLAQVVDCQSSFVWGTVIQERRWIGAARQSCERFSVVSSSCCLQVPPQTDNERFLWFQCASQSSKRDSCRNDIRTYCRHCIGSRAEQAEKAMAKAIAIQQLESQGALIISVPEPNQHDSGVECFCEACEVFFQDKRALASQMSIKHGETAEASEAAFTTTCEVCRKQFWTLKRARAHFARSAQCRVTHAAADISRSAQPISMPSARTDLPVTALVGPQPWWATLNPQTLEPQHPNQRPADGLGDRLMTVECEGDAIKVLCWWSRRMLLLGEAAIQDELEGIRVGDLKGIKLQVLAIAEHMIWPEADQHRGLRVLQCGRIFTAISHEACNQVTPEFLAQLSE